MRDWSEYVPEKHPRLGCIPFRKTVKVPTHGPLKDIPFFAVELRDVMRVYFESIVAPGVEDGVRDRLGQRRRL